MPSNYSYIKTRWKGTEFHRVRKSQWMKSTGTRVAVIMSVLCPLYRLFEWQGELTSIMKHRGLLWPMTQSKPLIPLIMSLCPHSPVMTWQNFTVSPRLSPCLAETHLLTSRSPVWALSTLVTGTETLTAYPPVSPRGWGVLLFSFLLVPFPSLVPFHLFNKHTP